LAREGYVGDSVGIPVPIVHSLSQVAKVVAELE
jgi:hypothetical protein